MRILCVSMLRLGDIIIHLPSLRALKAMHPEAEIHLLTNRGNLSIAQYLAGIDKVHYFERELIQESLGQSDRSVFEAQDRILDLVKRLQRQGYDKIINFSHTKISGRILGLISAPIKMGLQSDQNGHLFIDSNWFRFLNKFQGDEFKHHFHLSDFFCLASVGQSARHQVEACPFKNFNAKPPDDSDRIVINPWSSDEKKDWADLSWINLVKQLSQDLSHSKFALVCGPDKQDRANQIRAALAGANIVIDIIVKEFPDLYQYFKQQRLLITVDSVAKHIGALAGIKTIEICLGGSSAAKTGSYASGNLVLQSNLDCAPCDNHKACQKATHECGQSLHATDLATVAIQYLQGQWINIRAFAEDCIDQFKIYRTAFTKGGYWHLMPLWQNGENEVVDHLLSLAAWKVILDKSHLDPLFNFKAEIQSFESEDYAFSRTQLQLLDGTYRGAEMALDRAISQFVQKIKSTHFLSVGLGQGYRTSLVEIENDLGLNRFLTQFVDKVPTDGFGALRQIQESLNQLRQFQIAKLQFQKSALGKEIL